MQHIDHLGGYYFRILMEDFVFFYFMSGKFPFGRTAKNLLFRFFIIIIGLLYLCFVFQEFLTRRIRNFDEFDDLGVGVLH